MDDVVGDYKDKTVTLEDFPFFSNNIKMASVHPCKHASVMKTLLDRADASLRIRRDKLRAARAPSATAPAPADDALARDLAAASLNPSHESPDKDDWEEVRDVDADDHEVAIRVDQYLVVFLKVCPQLNPSPPPSSSPCPPRRPILLPLLFRCLKRTDFFTPRHA